MLGDDIAAALPLLRIEAERLMTDACRVKRKTGATPGPLLEEIPTYADVWSGPCRVQRSGALSPREASGAAGYEFGIDSLIAQLPIAAVGIRRGDVFEVTSVGPNSDPDLLDVEATVQGNLTKTHATKRTLVCEEVT